jgi:hypothetical protein
VTYANAVASLALFVALGGSSYAAVTITGEQVRDGSLTGRDIHNGSLTGRDIHDGSLTSRDVRDHSLLARDFKAGQLPRGPQGSPGPQGPVGAQGPAGTPDGYTKAEADGRFVQGGGDVTFRHSLLDVNGGITNWMSVNGVAHLDVSCAPASQNTVRLVSDSSAVVHAFASSVVYKSADMSEYELHHQGDGVDVLSTTFDSQETLQVLTGSPASTQLTTIVISMLADSNGGCRFVAHAVHSASSDPLT